MTPPDACIIERIKQCANLASRQAVFYSKKLKIDEREEIKIEKY